MADLDKLKAELETAENKAAAAAVKANDLRDNYDTARVEAMDEKVVEKAKELGINPRNFEDTEHLQAAIDYNNESIEEA